jgi:hypothetical protein
MKLNLIPISNLESLRQRRSYLFRLLLFLLGIGNFDYGV